MFLLQRTRTAGVDDEDVTAGAAVVTKPSVLADDTNGSRHVMTPSNSSYGDDVTTTPYDRISPTDDLPPLTTEQKEALAETAQALSSRGRGILAADESNPTVSTKLWELFIFFVIE